ncbi:hypothetical protein N7451_009741 [Penicillium sp. IBT 35674x]|nr:hypothetical protein N7451_009741 [Penicillium sp. IBT 35674x]
MSRKRVNERPNLDHFGQQPSNLSGLDTSGNPLLSHFESNYEKNLLLALPVTNTDVDWRENDRKPIAGSAARQGSTPRRAAYVQQVGLSAPKEYACSFCRRGGGPFESCKIAIAYGQLLFNGACGNCSWGAQTHKCSFRSGPLPPHIFNALMAANPDAPALSRGYMGMDEEHNEPDEFLTPAAPRQSLRSSATKRRRAEEIEGKSDKPDVPRSPKSSGRTLRSSATKRRRVEEVEESGPLCLQKSPGQALRNSATERQRAEESTDSDKFDDSDESDSDESDESSLPEASSRSHNRPTTKRPFAVEIKEEFDEDIDITEIQRPSRKSTNVADNATANDNSSSDSDTSSSDSDSSKDSNSSSDSDSSSDADISAENKAANKNNALDKGKIAEKGKSAEKSATKSLNYKIPNGPEYPEDLYSTVLLDPRLRGRQWPAIRSLRRDLAQLVERLQWEEKVVKAVLEKNGELEGPYDSSEEEDDLFAGLNL